MDAVQRAPCNTASWLYHNRQTKVNVTIYHNGQTRIDNTSEQAFRSVPFRRIVGTLATIDSIFDRVGFAHGPWNHF